MLVLSRKVDDTVIIGDNIKIQVMQVKGNRIRIGIEPQMMSKFFAANWHLTVWLRVETLIRNLQVSRKLDLQTALRQLNSKFPPKSCNRYLTLSLTRVNFAESGASPA